MTTSTPASAPRPIPRRTRRSGQVFVLNCPEPAILIPNMHNSDKDPIEASWSPVSLRREVKQRVVELSERLNQTHSETVSQGIDALEMDRFPVHQMLSTDLLRAAETLEITGDRLADTLAILIELAWAATAERLEEMANLARQFKSQSKD